MDQKALILWGNELQTNKLIAKAGRMVLYLSLFILFLNVIGILDALPSALWTLNSLLVIPLVLPTVLVDLLKKEEPWVKYVSLTAMVIATGIAYTLLTFQTVILFVMPTIVATLYFREKELKVVIVETVITIFVAHYLSYFFVAQPWIEPFYDLKAIMLYGAVPRVLQYLCFAVLCLIVCKKMMEIMYSYHEEKKLKEILEIKQIMEGQRIKYEERERMSRMLHHSVGHSITAAIMSLDAAEAIYEVSPKQAQEKVLRANERMRQSLEVIRETVRKEEVQYNLTLEEAIATINHCIANFQRDSGIKVRVSVEQTMPQGQACYIENQSVQELVHMIQELLTNSVKHGKATAIIIVIKLQQEGVYLLIQDNGRGTALTDELYEKGFGLKQIKQYVEAKQGTMTYTTHEGFGVAINYLVNWEEVA